MKKKILSLILGIFIGIASLFSFTSCSLVTVDEKKENQVEALRIGNSILTKQDIIDGFYTYYQNNSNYFAYYDSSTIEDSFYQWLIVRQLLNDKAAGELYDAETNPNGRIFYTKEDEEKVWNSVLDYFYSQVNSKEKIIYNSKNVSEDDFPVWLKSDEESAEASEFKEFESSIPEIDASKRTPENLRKKLSEDVVKGRLNELKAYIFEYVPDKNDLDENDKPVRKEIEEAKLESRRKAFLNYQTDLVANAKNSGTSLNFDDLLKDELYRIYEAYYSAKITELFQNFFVGEYLINFEGKGDQNALADAAIAEAFLNQYFTDKQNYSSEKGYIDTIESESGAPLILYHYDGVQYYFSVQHILLKYDSFVDSLVKAIDERPSESATSVDNKIYSVYKSKRDKYVKENYNSILTKLNLKDEDDATNEEVEESPKSLFESIANFGDYYYYKEDYKELYGFYFIDESLNKIKLTFNNAENNYSSAAGITYNKEHVTEVYHGFIKLSTHTYDEATNTVSFEFYPNYETFKSEAELYATEADVLDCFEKTYDFWIEQINAYLTSESDREQLAQKYPDLEYIFKVALDMKNSGSSLADIYSKVSTMLFVELEWIYSGDSLANEVSNKIGYIVSSEQGNNGKWDVDFALESRELLNQLNELATQDSGIPNGSDGNYTELEAIVLGLSSNKISDLTLSAASSFGIHILKVSEIYECGSSIFDVDSIIKKYGGKIDYSNKDFVDEIIEQLKKNYVTIASNETLYEYFKEALYKNFVGSSDSSGTYFLAKEYEWLAELFKEDKIVYTNKLSYDELMETLN